MGAQVLMNRSVQLGKRYGVEIEVLSSLVRKEGTIVREAVKKVEEMKITGIAKDEKVARVTVAGLPDSPGAAFKVFSTIARVGINVDVIVQNSARNGENDITFTVALADVEKAQQALEDRKGLIGFESVVVDKNIAKVSVVGAGMMSSMNIAALVFEALNDESINIQMITTSEIKISCIIAKDEADRAVSSIHKKFFET